MSSHDPDERTREIQSPFNPLPPVIAALALFVIGVEIVLSLGARGLLGGPGAIGWRIEAIQTYAFSARIFEWMWDTDQFPLEHMMRFITYGFVHTNFTHAVFVCVMLLALGKTVGEVFSALGTLTLFTLSSAFGALVFTVALDDNAPLVGGFPGVYGLLGAFTFLLWLRLGQMGALQMRAFSLIGTLLGIQLIFGLLFGAQNDWVADVAGFTCGFAVSFILIPGGAQALIDRFRRD